MIIIKQNKNKTLLIAVVVIAAVVLVSVITASVTGHVIKVQQSALGTDIYTKAEVDSMLKGSYYGCYDVVAGSTGNTPYPNHAGLFLGQATAYCNKKDIAVSGQYACNPSDWNMDKVPASLNSAVTSVTDSTGTKNGWMTTCVGDQNMNVIVHALCCKQR